MREQPRCAFEYPEDRAAIDVITEPRRCRNHALGNSCFCWAHQGVNNTPISQPDGHAGDAADWARHWIPSEHVSSFAGIPEKDQLQGITPEPIRNASNLPRTALGQVVSGPSYPYQRKIVKTVQASGESIPTNYTVWEDDNLHCGTSACNPVRVYDTPKLPKGLVADFLGRVENLEIMNQVLTGQVKQQREWRETAFDMLEYEKMKNDAYRKVWSARQYILQVRSMDNPDDCNAWAILNRALLELDIDRVPGVAIRDKYAAYMDGPQTTR